MMRAPTDYKKVPRLRTLLTLLALTLPALAPAQTQLGRLFASPAEREAMEAQRGASNGPAAVNMPQPGMQAPAADPNLPPAGAPAAPVAAEPTMLVLSGTLRSSSGRSTVWLNDQPQHDGQNPYSRSGKNAVTVTLPSGKRVQLKAGQRYDLGSGQVKDINEP